MRQFMLAWNQAANSPDGVKSLINPSMDVKRAADLAAFYSDLKKQCPGIAFNHAVQVVGTQIADNRNSAPRASPQASGGPSSGGEVSSLLVEARIQAAVSGGSPGLKPEMQPLIQDGYVRYFLIVPSGKSWTVADWEDGSFPVEMKFMDQASPLGK